MSVDHQRFDLVYSTNKRDITGGEYFSGDPKDYYAAAVLTRFDKNGKVTAKDQVIMDGAWIDADQEDLLEKAIKARKEARKGK